MRAEVSRIEREAARLNKQLIAVVDESGAAGVYIALGSVSREWEALSPDELEALMAGRGDALLVVHVEQPDSRLRAGFIPIPCNP